MGVPITWDLSQAPAEVSEQGSKEWGGVGQEGMRKTLVLFKERCWLLLPLGMSLEFLTIIGSLGPLCLTSMDSAVRKRDRHTCPETAVLFYMVSPVACATCAPSPPLEMIWQGEGLELAMLRPCKGFTGNHGALRAPSWALCVPSGAFSYLLPSPGRGQQVFPKYPGNYNLAPQGVSSYSS